VQNFTAICQTVTKISQLFDFFFKMAAVGHLGFVVWVFAALINSIWWFITVQNIVGIDEALSII